MPPSSASRSSFLPYGWRGPALLAAGTLVALLFAAQQALTAAATGRPYAFEDVVRTVLSWWTWLPFVPLAWHLVRRYPLERPVSARAMAIHVGGALAVFLAMGALYVMLHLALDVVFGAPPRAFGRIYPQFLLSSFAFDLVLYAALVAAMQAVLTRQEAQVRQAALERAERERLHTQALLSRAELDALRSHLNPHFLFNTLHAVSALMREDPPRAEQALERLSDLLRYALCLDRERLDLVRMADEIAFVRSYLALEALRYGSRLRTTWHVDPAASNALVPPFTVQSLVENAIKHAVSPRRQGAAITVTITLDEEQEHLGLCVADDGPGAEPDAVRTANGLGLRDLRLRLAALFADEAAVHTHTASGEGFEVAVTLPATFSLQSPSPALTRRIPYTEPA